jgi:transcriptional regulator with XRE-family HTH domain
MTTAMDEILEVLGQRMRELREKKGISQEDLAEFCGLHRTAVGLLERGKTIPRLDTLLLISQGLGVTVSKLLQGVEQWGKLPSKTAS